MPEVKRMRERIKKVWRRAITALAMVVIVMFSLAEVALAIVMLA